MQTKENARSDSISSNPTVRGVYEPHCVMIRDMRPVAEHRSLDGEGFALGSQPSAVTDFTMRTNCNVYYPEAEHLVASVTGASRAVVFDHTIRRNIPGKSDRLRSAPRQSSIRIHNDHSAKSGPQRVR